jgi:quinone-modifying oxidoreductase subunit QmoB
MEKKYGVYICKGCGIKDAVDVDKLAAGAAKAAKIPAEKVKAHDVLCSPDGVAMINGDIKDEGVNAISIAACSWRVKYEEFDFPGCFVDRTNIRELVAWSQPPMTEDTQALAADYVTMGIVKTQKGLLPEPGILEDLSKTIMVVGGGMTGLTAALDAANAGYDVVVVEKEPELGGMGAKLYRQMPTESPYEKLEEPAVFKKIKEVNANDRIKVFTSTTIAKTDGQPGLFDVTLSNGQTVRAGAFVMAAGWKPYDATKLSHLGYGLPNVVTSVQFEEMA